MILGIAGYPGVGKSSVVDILKTSGYTHYTNRELKKFYGNLNGKETEKSSLVKMMENFKTIFGIDKKVKRIYEIFDSNEKYVIEPIKSVALMDKLKAMDDLYLIYVQTDLNIRFKRYKEKISKEGAKKIFGWEDFKDIQIPKKLIENRNYKINNNPWCDLLDEENSLRKKVFEILVDIDNRQKLKFYSIGQ